MRRIAFIGVLIAWLLTHGFLAFAQDAAVNGMAIATLDRRLDRIESQDHDARLRVLEASDYEQRLMVRGVFGAMLGQLMLAVWGTVKREWK